MFLNYPFEKFIGADLFLSRIWKSDSKGVNGI